MTLTAPSSAGPINHTDLFSQTLQDVLAAGTAALAAADRPVGRSSLTPGSQVVWDNCEDNPDGDGQLWVRMVGTFPTSGRSARGSAGGRGISFPSPDTEQVCGITMLALQLGLGVVRCVHTVDNNGNPPTADQVTADALVMTADASDLLRAIKDLPGIRGTNIVTGWAPQGPSGGCAGGEWLFYLALPYCP